MRSSCFIRTGILLALTTALAAGCGDASDDDRDARGDVTCEGTECQCPGTGDCAVDCHVDCDLACTGSGDCAFTCGAGCEASCPGSGACLVDVGDDSSVVCSGSGGCDITCDGDCSVECPGSGECIVRCEPEHTCDIERCEGAVSCPDGVQVCNGECPE